MGQEIPTTRFTPADFARFGQQLGREMEVLAACFRDHRFSRRRAIGGLELEAWLVDEAGDPLPINDRFIERAASADVVAELAKFNIELNVAPQPLAGQGLSLLQEELSAACAHCDRVGDEVGASVVAIGILPTVTDAVLCPANMSAMRRYAALNERVLALRQGRPIRLDIVGREHLTSTHADVMLEAAATSLQLHLQVPQASAHRYYNAAIILSAPMVAAAANSPLLFGRLLWEETRIPLFEQAVDVGSPERRVTFGSGYARASLEECFAENLAHHPVLLPQVTDTPAERLAHVRLHNGTIWRWNRPLIGFDDDGTPHLRIEHRVMAAGPTLVDMAANMAVFFGLAEWLATEPHAPELRLPFATARQNFYAAARYGLEAHVDWYDGRRRTVARLFEEVLLEQARRGLKALHVDGRDIDRHLGIFAARVATGQTGAAWQRGFVERHGRDLGALTRAYRERSHAGAPVHEWTY